MTVREAVEKAYGPVPEGWTIHDQTTRDGGLVGVVTIFDGVYSYEWQSNMVPELGCRWVCLDDNFWAWGPDLSNHDANDFVGTFGDEYDRVVREANA